MILRLCVVSIAKQWKSFVYILLNLLINLSYSTTSVGRVKCGLRLCCIRYTKIFCSSSRIVRHTELISQDEVIVSTRHKSLCLTLFELKSLCTTKFFDSLKSMVGSSNSTIARRPNVYDSIIASLSNVLPIERFIGKQVVILNIASTHIIGIVRQHLVEYSISALTIG